MWYIIPWPLILLNNTSNNKPHTLAHSGWHFMETKFQWQRISRLSFSFPSRISEVQELMSVDCRRILSLFLVQHARRLYNILLISHLPPFLSVPVTRESQNVHSQPLGNSLAFFSGASHHSSRRVVRWEQLSDRQRMRCYRVATNCPILSVFAITDSR